MQQVLFHIGGLRVFSYGFFIALGILVATLWMLRQAKKEGMSQETVLDCVLIAVIAGIVGARLFYVFLEPQTLLKNSYHIMVLRT
jgi:phosphatidylglycerol:prolipoprotein diacylglycerol transferase